jgi:hypothetical protein
MESQDYIHRMLKQFHRHILSRRGGLEHGKGLVNKLKHMVTRWSRKRAKLAGRS